MFRKQIYMNNASTTKIYPQVRRIIARELKAFDNPSDISFQGFQNQSKITKAKDVISKSLSCDSDELYFTASGSEGDNMCIKMLALKQRELTGNNHIVTSAIEHKAILNSCKALEKLGFEITYIQPDKLGLIHLKDIEEAIKPTTCLVSIMYVNNILGVIQPINLISNLCHAHGILFHSDMVQALGHCQINLHQLDVDAATFAGHKIHGPRQGFVYIKREVPFDSFVDGGGQENNKRAGTENLPYIVGLAKAVQLSCKNIGKKNLKVRQMRQDLISYLVNIFNDNIIFNGSDVNCIPNILHFCLRNVSGEFITYVLSNGFNITVSEGSACNTGEMSPDYVLTAIGVNDEFINGSIRVSLDHFNTSRECKKFIAALTKVAHIADILKANES